MNEEIKSHIKRPPSKLGGPNWEKFPDEVFIQAERLRTRMADNPQTQEAFQFFRRLRPIENQELSAYAMLSGHQAEMRYEEAQIHPERKRIHQIRQNINRIIEMIREARENKEPLYEELQNQASQNPSFRKEYSLLESNFDAIVALYLPIENREHPSDRDIFDKAIFELLSIENEESGSS